MGRRVYRSRPQSRPRLRPGAISPRMPRVRRSAHAGWGCARLPPRAYPAARGRPRRRLRRAPGLRRRAWGRTYRPTDATSSNARRTKTRIISVRYQDEPLKSSKVSMPSAYPSAISRITLSPRGWPTARASTSAIRLGVSQAAPTATPNSEHTPSSKAATAATPTHGRSSDDRLRYLAYAIRRGPAPRRQRRESAANFMRGFDLAQAGHGADTDVIRRGRNPVQLLNPFKADENG